MAIATVNLKFGVNLDSFRSGLSKIEREMGKLGTKFQDIGSKLSVGVTLPIVALGAASLRAASDAEETFSKFDTVFRDIRGSAEEAFQSLRNEYGLSSTAAKQLLGDTGDLLTGFGFSQESALELSTQVQKLAVDLASFTNYSGGAAGASEALTKALLGERESVKALGIAILEEDVKKQMAINTAKGLIFETERQAKAQATLDLAIQQSTNAIGDYARTSGSFANQSRLLRARLEDISSELGKVFLPLATKITTKITQVVEWFSKLDDQVKQNIVVFAGIAAAIGPVLLGLGTLLKTLPLIATGFAAMTGPVGLAVTAVAIGIGVVLTNLDTFKLKLKTTLLEVIDFAVTAAKVVDTLTGVFPGFKATTTAALLSLKQAGEAVSKSIQDDLGKDSKSAMEEVTDQIKAMGDEARNSFNALSKLGQATPQINRTTDSGIQGPSVANPFGNLELQLPDQMQGISDRIREYSPQIWGAAQELTDTFSNILTYGASNGIASMATALGSAFAEGANVVKALGGVLLGAIGQIATELGKASIAIGVGMIAIKKAFTNPFTAIAAGIALVALGSFISNKVANITSGGGASGGGALGPAEGVPARAMGGTVQAGVPYLVGERGPELFTPSGFGNITNARQTAGMGGIQEILVRVENVLRGADIYQSGQTYARINGRTT